MKTATINCPHCAKSIRVFRPRNTEVTPEKPYKDQVITCQCKKKYFLKVYPGGRTLTQKL